MSLLQRHIDAVGDRDRTECATWRVCMDLTRYVTMKFVNTASWNEVDDELGVDSGTDDETDAMCRRAALAAAVKA